MGFWSNRFTAKQRRVYADAAAATPLSKRAEAEILRLLGVYGNAGGLHSEALASKQEIERARAAIATAVGAHKDEIIFTASGTEGNNLAIAGALRPLLHLRGSVHAITCAIEHQSVLEPLRALVPEGLELTILLVDSQGFVSAKNLRDAITDNTVFISIQLVNSEVGTILPIQEFAKEIRAAKKARKEALPLYFHTDASQAPLWVDMKMEKLGTDMATLDAQKVLGPKGVGALFVKRDTTLASQMLGGTQEFGLRGGTPNTPMVGSFAIALADSQKGIEARVAHTKKVRDFCFNEMQRLLPNIQLNGPALDALRAPNSLNVSVPGLDAQMAVIALNTEGVAASTRSACNIGEEDPSHVIQALGVPKELAGTAIRLTLLPTATMSDARFIAQALYNVAERYGKK